MSKRLFKTMVALLAIAAAAAGPVRGQNASPDVTLDFTSNTWGIPEGTEGKTAVENSYTSGGYTITLCGSSGNGYYFSLTEPYILLGKQGAYLQLPAFSSAVDSIHVVGTSSASTAVEQNIYVGETAVSTQTTGMKNVTQKYVINEDYRTAGTIYRIKVTSAHNTQIKKVLVYFTPASAGSSTPEPNQTTYNVTFGGFSESEMNTTVNVTSLPQTFTQIGNDALYPWTVISTSGNIFYGATVTSGGEGKVSVSVPTFDEMSITVTGPFEGTATIHVTGEDDENRDISCDITVSCVAVGGGSTPSVPHTVRFASGNDGWTVTDVDSARSATAPAVLQNVMAGDSLVVTAPATLPGKVKSVKAVKYVPPVVITWNTTNVLKEANQNDELNRNHRTPLTYEGITISFSGNDVSSFNPYSTAREYPALECHGDDGDSFTFTAPSGKKFTKIEINDNSYINFDAYGDWTKPENNKIVWRGTAANAVTLGSVFTLAGQLNSIVFTLIDD